MKINLLTKDFPLVQVNKKAKSRKGHRRYRKQKFNDIELEDIQIEDTQEIHEDTEKLGKDIKLYINNLPFYQRELANKHFVEGTSQREMSKMYNINRIHISKDVNTIKKKI